MGNKDDNSLSAHALIAFAFIEDEYAKTGDLVAGLLPLFGPLLAGQTGRIFDPKIFAQDVSMRYGIPMSPLVAEGLIERLAHANLLYLEDTDSQVYRVSKVSMPSKLGIDDRSIEIVLDEFVEFATQGLARLELTQAPDALKNGFLARLTSAQFLSAVERNEANYFVGNKLTLKNLKSKKISLT